MVLQETSSKRVIRWQRGEKRVRARDEVAVEEPLEIRVDTRPVVVTMRTPGNDEELAAGFLVTEGLVRRRSDIMKVSRDPRSRGNNVVNVFLSPAVTVDFGQLTRHVYASSSCGLCGKASIESVQRRFPRIGRQRKIRAETLLELPAMLRRGQAMFEKTGGLHAAGLFDRRGRLVVLREDVGRHNAVDKVLGFAFLRGTFPCNGEILMVSGRASFEILQKALAARIGMVAAVSAPSSLAVEFAQKSGQTLIGFLRGDRMNIYAHAERVAEKS